MEEGRVDAKEEMKWENIMTLIDLAKNIIIIGKIMEGIIMDIIDIMIKGIEVEAGVGIKVGVEVGVGVEAEVIINLIFVFENIWKIIIFKNNILLY